MKIRQNMASEAITMTSVHRFRSTSRCGPALALPPTFDCVARNLARTMGTRSAAVGRGLAAAPTGLGTFIAYSTQPGNVALDGDGRNSPFTAALVKHMSEQDAICRPQ